MNMHCASPTLFCVMCATFLSEKRVSEGFYSNIDLDNSKFFGLQIVGIDGRMLGFFWMKRNHKMLRSMQRSRKKGMSIFHSFCYLDTVNASTGR